MGFTFSKRLFISLHFEKKRMKNDQVRAELQLAERCEVKIKSCRLSISLKLICLDCIAVEKGVKCALRLDQW